MVSIRYYRRVATDVSRPMDASPTSAALGSWPNRRAWFPDVWPPAITFYADLVVTNGSRSKLMVGERIDSIVRQNGSAVQPVHTACTCNAGGLLSRDRVHHPAPLVHACRLVPCHACPHQ